jgi:hypothetical protein
MLNDSLSRLLHHLFGVFVDWGEWLKRMKVEFDNNVNGAGFVAFDQLL